jgi:acetate kinase
MNQHILTINSGSSSIKFALFEKHDALTEVFRGAIENIGQPHGVFWVKFNDGTADTIKHVESSSISSAVQLLCDWTRAQIHGESIVSIGYRIVHGAVKYNQPTIITDELIDYLRSITLLDPDHIPQTIALVESFRSQFPHVSHVACFDTAFHRDMPTVARLLPIPRKFEKLGIQRYGFHGLSYASVLEQVRELAGSEAANGKLVFAHLGSGASLAAIENGTSVDTSMCFTPASGIPMGTRSGDLDPGILSYLAQSEGYDVTRIHAMVNFESGLLGMSETSSNVHELLEREESDSRAKEALDVFCYQIKKSIGAYAAAMGGIDMLVFTGGIGERASQIRSRICKNLEFLGIVLDEQKNNATESVISSESGNVQIRVVHVNEERMLAKQTAEVLAKI